MYMRCQGYIHEGCGTYFKPCPTSRSTSLACLWPVTPCASTSFSLACVASSLRCRDTMFWPDFWFFFSNRALMRAVGCLSVVSCRYSFTMAGGEKTVMFHYLCFSSFSHLIRLQLRSKSIKIRIKTELSLINKGYYLSTRYTLALCGAVPPENPRFWAIFCILAICCIFVQFLMFLCNF